MTQEETDRITELAKADFRAHFGLEVLGMQNVAQTFEEREKQAVNRALAEVEARRTTAALRAGIEDVSYPPRSDAASPRTAGA